MLFRSGLGPGGAAHRAGVELLAIGLHRGLDGHHAVIPGVDAGGGHGKAIRRVEGLAGIHLAAFIGQVLTAVRAGPVGLVAGRTAGSGLSLGLLRILMVQRRDDDRLVDAVQALGITVQAAVCIRPVACRAGLGAGGGNRFYLGDGLPAQQRIAGAVGSKLIAQGRERV